MSLENTFDKNAQLTELEHQSLMFDNILNFLSIDVLEANSCAEIENHLKYSLIDNLHCKKEPKENILTVYESSFSIADSDEYFLEVEPVAGWRIRFRIPPFIDIEYTTES